MPVIAIETRSRQHLVDFCTDYCSRDCECCRKNKNGEWTPDCSCPVNQYLDYLEAFEEDVVE